MAKLSRVEVAPERWQRFMDDFWSAISVVETKEEVRDFLIDILTPTERRMLAKRFQIAMMLLLDYDYNSVSDRVKVTSNTIAKVSNQLKDGSGGLKKVANLILGLKRKSLVQTK